MPVVDIEGQFECQTETWMSKNGFLTVCKHGFVKIGTAEKAEQLVS